MNVVWLGPTGMWSLGWLEQIFDGHEWYRDFFIDGGAYVVIAAEYMADQVTEINAELAKLPWSVVILASDERGLFPVEELSRNIDALWVMTPHFEKHDYPEGTHFMGEGCPQKARALIAAADRKTKRPYRVGFSGQITHERRQELASVMSVYPFNDWYYNPTPGFTQGLGRAEYYQLLVDSETVPAPSGPETLDSFRAFETLEAGGVPILDLVCPVPQPGYQYWDAILGEGHPLPSVWDWHQLDAWDDEIHERWPGYTNMVFSWWQLHKRRTKREILSASPVWVASDHITILMPTSPVPSNPDLAKITQTVESVRHHLPTADILILCDGVREEQEDRREAYEQFVSDLLWKANTEWTNVYPIVSPKFVHQCGTTKLGLAEVTTDLIMYVEHDIPLVTDLPIDWQGIIRLVQSEEIDILKFSFEAMGIHPEHEYMALDREIVYIQGVPVRRSVQYSQRPHVARTNYYRYIMDDWFTPSSRTMIEDRLHGVAQDHPDEFHIATYMPDGSKVRCYHIDGRETDEKFSMVY